MHSTQVAGGMTTFYFNPDLSGKVIVRTKSGHEFRIPSQDLAAFAQDLPLFMGWKKVQRLLAELEAAPAEA